MPATWVVLDFSGTLSLEATLFGREENLLQALRASGLWRLGVRDVAFFWSQIVAPTWQEGSTTPKGYRRVLAERLGELAPQGVQGSEAERLAAAERFVARYLAHTTIVPAWGPVLKRLQQRPHTRLIVGSDHYAEATAHIVEQLHALGVAAAPAGMPGAVGEAVLVANSADLGHPKASRPFWEALKRTHAPEPTTILLVDDFGANENPLDRYADPTQVAARQKQTIELLSFVLGAQVIAFAFLLDDPLRVRSTVQALEKRYHVLIDQAARFLFNHLSACTL